MIKITFWFDYNSLEKFKSSFIWNMLEKLIDFDKCISYKAEETEVIN